MNAEAMRQRIEERKLELNGVTAAVWNPDLHPRGRDGKFIEKLGWISWTNPDGSKGRGQVDEIRPDPTQPGRPDIIVNFDDAGQRHIFKPDEVDTEAAPKASLTETPETPNRTLPLPRTPPVDAIPNQAQMLRDDAPEPAEEPTPEAPADPKQAQRVQALLDGTLTTKGKNGVTTWSWEPGYEGGALQADHNVSGRRWSTFHANTPEEALELIMNPPSQRTRGTWSLIEYGPQRFSDEGFFEARKRRRQKVAASAADIGLYLAWERELAQQVREPDVAFVASLEASARDAGFEMVEVAALLGAWLPAWKPGLRWNPDLHPRGRDGTFIETFGWVNLRHLALPPRGDEPLQTVENVTEYDEAPMGRPGVRENRLLDNVRGKVMGVEPDPEHPGVPLIHVEITSPDGATETVVARPYNIEEAPKLKGRLGESIEESNIVLAVEQLEDARKDAVLLGDPVLVAQIDAELERLRKHFTLMPEYAMAASAVRENDQKGDWRTALLAAIGPLSAAIWNPDFHPRGRDGRFIETFGLVEMFLPHWGSLLGEVQEIVPDPDSPGNPDIMVRVDDPRWPGDQSLRRVKPYQVESRDKRKAMLEAPGLVEDEDTHEAIAEFQQAARENPDRAAEFLDAADKLAKAQRPVPSAVVEEDTEEAIAELQEAARETPERAAEFLDTADQLAKAKLVPPVESVQPSARLRITPTTYRGEAAFQVTGRDAADRRVGPFVVRTREAAENIRSKLGRGEEITLADYGPSERIFAPEPPRVEVVGQTVLPEIAKYEPPRLRATPSNDFGESNFVFVNSDGGAMYYMMPTEPDLQEAGVAPITFARFDRTPAFAGTVRTTGRMTRTRSAGGAPSIRVQIIPEGEDSEPFGAWINGSRDSRPVQDFDVLSKMATTGVAKPSREEMMEEARQILERDQRRVEERDALERSRFDADYAMRADEEGISHSPPIIGPPPGTKVSATNITKTGDPLIFAGVVDGEPVEFYVTSEESAQLNSVLSGDLAQNFSGVEIDTANIVPVLQTTFRVEELPTYQRGFTPTIRRSGDPFEGPAAMAGRPFGDWNTFETGTQFSNASDGGAWWVFQDEDDASGMWNLEYNGLDRSVEAHGSFTTPEEAQAAAALLDAELSGGPPAGPAAMMPAEVVEGDRVRIDMPTMTGMVSGESLHGLEGVVVKKPKAGAFATVRLDNGETYSIPFGALKSADWQEEENARAFANAEKRRQDLLRLMREAGARVASGSPKV